MYQNKVTLIGFLGNDAEVRTNDNRSFTTLSLATKSSYKKDGKYISHTEWHRCVIFGKKLAEFAATLRRALISRSKASCAAASTTARRRAPSRPSGKFGWTRFSSWTGLRRSARKSRKRQTKPTRKRLHKPLYPINPGGRRKPAFQPFETPA